MAKESEKLVAIINTSVELVEILEFIFKEAGYRTKSIFTLELKSKNIDVNEFIKTYKPDAIIYDIAIPYEENYQFFNEISNRFDSIPIVLTTTNKNALEKLVGKTDSYEIIGKPFDLNELIKTVNYKCKSSKAAS